MRVLHVNDYPTGGGCEVLVTATIDLLRARGIEADLFTIDDVPNHWRTPRRYIDHHAAGAALADRLEQCRPDAVHLHNFYHELSPGILAALRAWKRSHHYRLMMTAHDYHLVCPNSGGNWFRSVIPQPIDPARIGSVAYLLTRRWDHRGHAHSALKLAQHLWNYRLLNRRAIIDTVICPSRFMQRIMSNTGLPTVHLPHPAFGVHAPLAREHRYGPFRAVFAGRIEPEKGLADLLRIMPDDSLGVFSIIGEGSELDRCRSIVAERGWADRVEFLGRLPHAQTLAIIARCHLMVLPSVCLENYPLSLIEALSAGTNILVSDRGGMSEMVEDFGVGFTFAPGDASSLADAMKRIARQHRDGSLNSFDVSAMLEARGETAYVEALMRLCACDSLPSASP